jgi:hypothetical protein
MTRGGWYVTRRSDHCGPREICRAADRTHAERLASKYNSEAHSSNVYEATWIARPARASSSVTP